MVNVCKCIPLCIRGEDLDPPNPSHKSLGPNLSLYKEVSPVKTWGVQKAGANLGQGAKNCHKSDLQEGGPTLMAKLSSPSMIQLDFFSTLFVEDSVLSGGWVPSNLEHFVETEAFSVQVLLLSPCQLLVEVPSAYVQQIFYANFWPLALSFQQCRKFFISFMLSAFSFNLHFPFKWYEVLYKKLIDILHD